MRKILLLLAVSFAFIAQGYAEKPLHYTLSGRVVDKNGEPLVGASVMLEKTLLGTSTALDGKFRFDRLPAGTYTLVVSYLGYDTEKTKVVLDANREVEVTMSQSALWCDDVIVSATRASDKMPIAHSSMNREQIAGTNNGFDIPFLLELMPSVVASSEGGTGFGNTALRIRGTDPSRINVTVNGVPLNDAESQGVYWVDLPDFASSVNNLQVQRGVGTSTNGAAAFGATVNFQTVSLNPEPFAAFDMLAGSYNTFKATAKVGSGLIGKHFSFEGRFSQLHTDGYIRRAGADHRSMFLTAAWHTEKSLVRFNLIHGEEHTAITWEGTPDYMIDVDRRYNPAGEYTDSQGNTRYYDDQKDNYWQTHYQLLSSIQLTRSLRLNITAHATDGRGFYEEYKENKKFADYALPSVINGQDTIRKTDLVRRKWMDNIFYGAIASLTYSAEPLEITCGGAWNRYDGDHFGKILWLQTNSGVPKDFEWYRNNGLKTDWNFYVKSTLQLSNRVSLFADAQVRGIGYDLDGIDSDLMPLNQKHSWLFFNPKAGATIVLNPANELYGSVGIANREPTRSDLKDAMKGAVNFTPKSERLYDFELGYRHKQKVFAFNINAYYMHYRDQLVPTGELSDVGYVLMTNVPKSYRAGVELIWGVAPLKGVRWDANVTLSRNIIRDYVNHVELFTDAATWGYTGQTQAEDLGDVTIAYSPSVVAGSKLSVTPLPALTCSWVSKYVGKQYIDNTMSNSRSLDAYWVNNFILDYRFKPKSMKSLYLQLHCNNVFSARYESNAWVYRVKFQNGDPEYTAIGYYPQAEFNFVLKLGLEF